jgi:sporulation protein YlmC with PRC-barrel domain
MKSNRIQLVAICVAAALYAQLSSAQSSSQSSSQSSGSSAQSSDNTTNGLHIRKLLGADVRSTSGESLGKLEDIVLDPQTGKATFAIVGKGGILKLGEKRLPVPWQALSVDPSTKRLTVNKDNEKLRSAPTVSSADATDLENPAYTVVIYEFYDVTPPSSGAADQTPGGSSSGSSSSKPSSGSSSSGSSSQPDSSSSSSSQSGTNSSSSNP